MISYDQLVVGILMFLSLIVVTVIPWLISFSLRGVNPSRRRH
uniref:Uncharacterized protein n=1 Tax=Leviviridae sp. TaxID=2027243 RepID=A0A514D7N1_9VIRU|nr:MAG: hypothetical protein H1RhizoLitter31390_000003 [Leviviridae sp.]